jgi:bifunctional DNA-binding transcriptional regulator/antitoxin component of YhaV-PrlF toxin-antitoxin module
METTTLSTKYQLVIPLRIRERMGLVPAQLTVLERASSTWCPAADARQRRLARGNPRGLREKKDRL